MSRKRLEKISDIIQAFKDGTNLYFYENHGHKWEGAVSFGNISTSDEFWIEDVSIKSQAQKIIKTGYITAIKSSMPNKFLITRINTDDETLIIHGNEFTFIEIIENYKSITQEEFLRID